MKLPVLLLWLIICSMAGSRLLSHAFLAPPVPMPTTTALRSTKVPTISSKTAAEIQAQAEAQARARHDNNAMNALFSNVDEHPEPQVCTLELGSIPTDLPAGSLLRIGPNGARQTDGWLDGDGLIQCIVLPPDNRQPVFSSKYVETRGRTLERENSPKHFRGTLGAAPRGLPMLKNLLQNAIDFGTAIVQKDTCNTAVAISGDRVMALMEQSPPSEIEVAQDGRIRTLSSMCNLGGAVADAPISGGSFSAHGRTDPRNGERIHVSYSSVNRPFVRVDTFGSNWELVRSVGVDTQAPVMIHDCAITDNYVVILDFPLTVRPRRLLQNNFPVEYEPTNGARIGLTPRHSDKDSETIWFEVDLGVALHLANAFERPDGKVVIHGFKAIPKGDSSFILDYAPCFLHEWVLDPVTHEVVSDECLNPQQLVEFPTIEVRFVGRDSKHVYGLEATTIGGPLKDFKTPRAGLLLDGVVKFSISGENSGEVVDQFTLESGWHFVSEPTPVTKTGGEGSYLLLIATHVPNKDRGTLTSRLMVLDTDDMASGPIAMVSLPHHVNYGLHSLYLPWEKMV